ncbi:MAG: hypothetical protein AAF579_11055 [Cyanobacteria bacterium P01_C01_bin.118]
MSLNSTYGVNSLRIADYQRFPAIGSTKAYPSIIPLAAQFFPYDVTGNGASKSLLLYPR